MAEPTVQIINAIEVNKVTKLIKNVHPRGCTHPTLDSNLLETTKMYLSRDVDSY